MSGSLEGRIRLRYILLLVIITTLPAYCCGIVLLRLAPNPSRQPTATTFRLFTRTPTLALTNVVRTPPATLAGLTIIPSQTLTSTPTATLTATATGTPTPSASPTASQTSTVTPTFTLSPSVTPSLTPPPSLTLTPTYTATTTNTPTATETRRPPDTPTYTPESPSPTP